ncbi:hypothetical protein [Rufibacter hautae]|uniref:STAS/SEC14 domain-containing protein n=1 Tax=Rufibacter hautae TaxID=2595005 RepID=A0A5B6TMM9_9BACT|nr:hypothetical protein [Rufibacter hautae]KAA3437573.1 hypothetical protein FOA19_09670 [Rufibacter hautae]
MLLYQDSILQLTYDPATDILEMDWPDLTPSYLPETKQALQALVETVRDYDVKNLLVDGSKASVTISDEENATLLLKIAQEFNATRLRKVARIASTDLRRETAADENLFRIQHSLDLHYQMQNFTDRAQAMTWLKDIS